METITIIIKILTIVCKCQSAYFFTTLTKEVHDPTHLTISKPATTREILGGDRRDLTATNYAV